MSTIEDKAVDILDKMDQLLTQYTPELVQTATDVVQINGFNTLFGSLSFIISIVLVGILGYRYRKSISKQIDIDDGREFPIYMAILIYSMLVLSSVVVLFRLIDVWVWIALFNPKLALAHQVLGL